MRRIGGVRAFSLQLTPLLSLSYAVFDGKLVVSTAPGGIRAVVEDRRPLTDDGAFDDTLAGRPRQVTSLVFLDFDQLLDLAEATGLGADPRYLAVREDLRKVRALGGYSSSSGRQTTAEITLQIK